MQQVKDTLGVADWAKQFSPTSFFEGQCGTDLKEHWIQRMTNHKVAKPYLFDHHCKPNQRCTPIRVLMISARVVLSIQALQAKRKRS